MKPRTGRKVLCVENVDNAVYGNAFIISRQGNKYQWNRSHPIIGYFDWSCFIGLKFDGLPEEMGLFCITNKSKFTGAIVAMIVEGLR
jgi:hypothetical protein